MIGKFFVLLLALVAHSPAVMAYDPDHVIQLKQTGSCAGCDLRGIVYWPDFKPKMPPTISDINHSGIISDLQNANLQSANLSYADLTGLNLDSANLTNAVLINARLANVSLIAATLTAATLQGTILTNANLSAAILDNADLTRTNLVGANMTGASFAGAVFSHTDFRYADLSRAIKFDSLSLDSRQRKEYRKVNNSVLKPDDGCKTRMPSGLRTSYDCDHAIWNDESFQTLGRTQ
ncbi:MAG: hypothetical protein ACI9FD_003421 [Gammaproteobacteria bacterium]|jgi:hypothetical protein